MWRLPTSARPRTRERLIAMTAGKPDGGIDILVNNAAVILSKAVHE